MSSTKTYSFHFSIAGLYLYRANNQAMRKSGIIPLSGIFSNNINLLFYTITALLHKKKRSRSGKFNLGLVFDCGIVFNSGFM